MTAPEQNSPNRHPGSNPDALENSRNAAIKLARLMADRHCRQIVILELADRSPVARHFVIGTGTSEQQIRSVAHELEEFSRELSFPVFGRAGIQQGRWAIVDLVDIVVHLFDQEYRDFYDLELLWGDAPKIPWQREISDTQNDE